MGNVKIPMCLIKPKSAHALKRLAPHLKAKPEMLCPECRKPVIPVGNHFEHSPRNDSCRLLGKTRRE